MVDLANGIWTGLDRHDDDEEDGGDDEVVERRSSLVVLAGIRSSKKFNRPQQIGFSTAKVALVVVNIIK